MCGPIRSLPLYDLDGSGAIERFAADIKAYWREHTQTTSGAAASQAQR